MRKFNIGFPTRYAGGGQLPATLIGLDDTPVALRRRRRRQGRLAALPEVARGGAAASTAEPRAGSTVPSEGQHLEEPSDLYASVLKNQGKLQEAERVYREVIERKTAALGAGHLETLNTKYNLGALLLDSGDRVLARPLLEEAAVGRAEALGEDHEHTQAARTALVAATAAAAARPREAPSNTASSEGQDVEHQPRCAARGS